MLIKYILNNFIGSLWDYEGLIKPKNIKELTHKITIWWFYVSQVNKSKARHRRLQELQTPGPVQWMGLLSERLCVGYQAGFTRYSIHGDCAPVSLLHPEDHTLAFISQQALDALCAVEISSKELLLCFSAIGVYVDSQGRRSRQQELMWPAVPNSACEF